MSTVSMTMIAVKTRMTCCQRCTDADDGEKMQEKVACPRRRAVVILPATLLLSRGSSSRACERANQLDGFREDEPSECTHRPAGQSQQRPGLHISSSCKQGGKTAGPGGTIHQARCPPPHGKRSGTRRMENSNTVSHFNV